MPTIEIDRDTAREAAERELAKPIYPRPSLREQLIDFVETLLQRLVAKGATVPGGWFTISVLVLLTVVAVVAAVRISRRTLGGGHGEPALFGAAKASAAEHRTVAQRCAAAGDWAGAIRHRLRAVARELEQAGVVDAAPGRTATELARTAGAALPALADDLTRAAQTFNDVSYGELPATEPGYRLIADLDETLRRDAVPA
ncbi:DUF4129 domain-containing protein [Mycobacterium sp. M1]|uniref:DUF4129 domain-containing protein n=1 Tax=Mycolicibacter acidiphilus TaxID=2835306 RepID=A0ABS5RPG1_9MYCO|nr:DUF4129 domain-containing protein [Mycolicibacter acidiphilus]MBS9536191.1 DUF4129 domain-containing protein [Mycolicibacter acidiphilus]